MLNDGSAAYLYDPANRLISTTLSGVTSLYGYNGDGARLKQTVAGVVTSYTQDLVAPLPVVLQAKTGATTTPYLYAIGTRPIAQYTSGSAEYLLSDALGSVRQIVDANGNVTLAKSYEPYGTVLTSTGTASSIFAYAGEQIDTYIKLLFLRARYMNPRLGIFLARDPWSGEVMRPGSMNGWNYAEGNPVRYTDPSGYIQQAEEADANRIRATLETDYSVLVTKDYGLGPKYSGVGPCGQQWYEGAWNNAIELEWVLTGITDMANTMGGKAKFKSAMRARVWVVRSTIRVVEMRPFAPPAGSIIGDIVLPDYTFTHNKDYAIFTIVHEAAHVWDRRTDLRLSEDMSKDPNIHTRRCALINLTGTAEYCTFDITAGSKAPAGAYLDPRNRNNWRNAYAAGSAMEDWAESLASVVYPNYYGAIWSGLGPHRRAYVQNQINAIP